MSAMWGDRMWDVRTLESFVVGVRMRSDTNVSNLQHIRGQDRQLFYPLTRILYNLRYTVIWFSTAFPDLQHALMFYIYYTSLCYSVQFIYVYLCHSCCTIMCILKVFIILLCAEMTYCGDIVCFL